MPVVLTAKEMPRHAPHAALNNDPLKQFFREHKFPHFAVEMNRWILCTFWEKRHQPLKIHVNALDHQTCSAPGIAMTPTLCKIKFLWKQQQNSMIRDGQWMSVISAHWFGGPTCYWSALPLGLPLHNQPLPWHGCHLHSSSRLHW